MQAVRGQSVWEHPFIHIIPCLSLHSFLKQVSIPKAFFVGNKVNNLLLGLSLGEPSWLMMDSLPFKEPEL